MEALTIDYNSGNLLQELKDNDMMPNYTKIKLYKEYLVNEKKLYYPDMLIEWIAREHLDLKYSEEDLCVMREDFVNKQNKINNENKLSIEETL